METDLNQLVTATLAATQWLAWGLSGAKPESPAKTVGGSGANPKSADQYDFKRRRRGGREGGNLCFYAAPVTAGWSLTVSDNGCGISKEFMNQCLFRPFKTTKPQGTGIGLFQSKMIVEAHNGVIEVESREGQGSTFRVLLPVKGPSAD